jgi:hypothetical protein
VTQLLKTMAINWTLLKQVCLPLITLPTKAPNQLYLIPPTYPTISPLALRQVEISSATSISSAREALVTRGVRVQVFEYLWKVETHQKIVLFFESLYQQTFLGLGHAAYSYVRHLAHVPTTKRLVEGIEDVAMIFSSSVTIGKAVFTLHLGQYIYTLALRAFPLRDNCILILLLL